MSDIQDHPHHSRTIPELLIVWRNTYGCNRSIRPCELCRETDEALRLASEPAPREEAELERQTKN
jgi:hypothetical protein